MLIYQRVIDLNLLRCNDCWWLILLWTRWRVKPWRRRGFPGDVTCLYKPYFSRVSKWGIPSGKLTVCYWKWPLKSLIYPLKIVIFKSYVQLTERDDEMAILATVILADHTGEIERILVDEQNLQALAAVASKEQLLTLLQKRGPAGICFKHPVDVRLATNNRKLALHDPTCLLPLPVCCRRKKVKQQLCNCQNVSFNCRSHTQYQRDAPSQTTGIGGSPFSDKAVFLYYIVPRRYVTKYLNPIFQCCFRVFCHFVQRYSEGCPH